MTSARATPGGRGGAAGGGTGAVTEAVAETVTETVIERFRALVADRLGLEIDGPRRDLLGEVLARRLTATALGHDDYLRALAYARLDGELGAVAEALTVGETYLFRNIEQFRALAEVALPALVRGRPAGGAIRILSAGCASGDEPYSIAIAAREALRAPWTLAIRAVDANRAMLARARRARYRAWSLRETPDDVRQRYFHTSGRDLVLDDAVRGAVGFEQRNLAADDPELWAAGSYDVVFCRNVIMYFGTEVQRAVVDRIANALAPDGYLFLGHAETLRALSQRFELCHSHGAFYYRRCGERGAPAARAVAIAIAAPPRRVESDPGGDWVDAIRGAAERIAALTGGTGSSAEPGARDAAAAPLGTAPRRDLGDVLALVRRERFGDALVQLEALPPDARRQPDAVLVHAALLAHGGRFSEAGAACRGLVAAEPAVIAGAHYVLALCCEAAGDRRGAEDHDQTAVYHDAGFAMPRLHLGLAARRGGDRETARRELGHALVLLERESPARLLLFGGGFDRAALISLCRAELAACGASR